jgi:hypothetical protein
MSGMPDDWAAGGRRVRQADGRRTRRSEGRHARTGPPEDEQAPEFTLPEVSDLDDDPKTLAEDAQWAAKLRPGRAPGAPDQAAPPPAEVPPAAPTTDSWPPAAASPSPSTGADPWETSLSDGTGEVWGSSPGASGDGTAEPWAAAQPSTSTSSSDLWGAPPAGGTSTGDWTSPGEAFQPERPAPDWSLGPTPPAPAAPAAPAPPPGSDTGSWAGIGGGSGSWSGGTDPATPWEPDVDVDPWAPEATSRPPWESAAANPSTADMPFRSAKAPQAPPAMPWEAQPPPRPEPTSTASDPSTSSGTDFRELFAELARDREATPPPAPAPAAGGPGAPGEDPAVQAAHAEARRLIEEATGQWLWDADKRAGTGEVAAPTSGYRTGSAYGLPEPGSAGGVGSPTAFGHGGQAPGATLGGYGGTADPRGTDPGRRPPSSWSEPLPPPPVPDGSGPYGPALSFAPPGSAPTEVGPSATPPPPSRDLTPTRGPGRHERSDEPLWTPDRRAGEDDTGGVGWLWSVEEHGASPPVPGSWLREPPKSQVREVDGLARSIEGRQLRQLEGRSQGRRARRSQRWPIRIAIASWLVLFAVLCWLYFFPWLEGVLPENF